MLWQLAQAVLPFHQPVDTEKPLGGISGRQGRLLPDRKIQAFQHCGRAEASLFSCSKGRDNFLFYLNCKFAYILDVLSCPSEKGQVGRDRLCPGLSQAPAQGGRLKGGEAVCRGRA